MTLKSLLLGAAAITAAAGIAGCGSSTTPTSTSSGTGTAPSGTAGSGASGNSGASGSNGSAAANTLLTVADVQTISGDPNVAAVSGTCTATTCVYADTTSTGGGGGVVVVEAIPGGLNQAAMQLALSTALAAGGSNSSGGAVTSVSGLGSAAIKQIDANSATYAFSKDNYFVVISISSSKNSGAAMDSQVQAAAQTAAGQL
jgi:hypothetical protein